MHTQEDQQNVGYILYEYRLSMRRWLGWNRRELDGVVPKVLGGALRDVYRQSLLFTIYHFRLKCTYESVGYTSKIFVSKAFTG